ncbi:hypothetical protein ElyMa_003334800, partial [Elysia marginata]
MEETVHRLAEAKSVTMDYFQEFYDQTYTEPPEDRVKSPSLGNGSVAMGGAPSSTGLRPSQATDRQSESHGEHFSRTTAGDVGRLSDETPEVPLEPMLEAYETDDCDDFYYISRGWGLYLT